MKQETIVVRAQRVCRRLCRWSHAPGRVPLWRVSYHFAMLQILIEHLTPSLVDVSDLSYLRNRVSSSRRLWEDGLAGAARYQLQELVNKILTPAATASPRRTDA